MKGLLPPDVLALLHTAGIKHMDTAISDEVEQVLAKLWRGEELSRKELNLDITPSELAALWTLTHQRAILPDTARQILRRKGTQIKPSKQWGSGPALRRLYRLGDMLEVRVRDTGRHKEEMG